jgi:hypothetical protein
MVGGVERSDKKNSKVLLHRRASAGDFVFNPDMAQSLSGRRVHGGKGFGIFMIAVVVLLVLLMLYFRNHSSSAPRPTHPPGLFGQLALHSLLRV